MENKNKVICSSHQQSQRTATFDEGKKDKKKMEVGIHILNFVPATILAGATRTRPCISALLQYNSNS